MMIDCYTYSKIVKVLKDKFLHKDLDRQFLLETSNEKELSKKSGQWL